MEKEDENDNLVLPLVPWVYDPNNQNTLAGVLLVPRVNNFRVTIPQFRNAIDTIDATHNEKFLDHVPHVIADDEAFARTAQHFRHNNGSLLRVPQPAHRNPRYTWATQVVDAATEMVSMQGLAWLEFRRDQKNKPSGTVYYSTQADGFPMPGSVSTEFETSFDRNKRTFGTSDCRTMLAAMLNDLSAKLIGRNIWFIPATSKLAVFADLMNAINALAGHNALVVFEIAKTQQNNTVARQVITEVFKRQLDESVTAVNEYLQDMQAYTADPKNNKMRYKSRASRNLKEVNALITQAKLYADVMGEMAQDALQQATKLRETWQEQYTKALIRDGDFGGVDVMLNVVALQRGKAAQDAESESESEPDAAE
jgi:hypothetical protein